MRTKSKLGMLSRSRKQSPANETVDGVEGSDVMVLLLDMLAWWPRKLSSFSYVFY